MDKPQNQISASAPLLRPPARPPFYVIKDFSLRLLIPYSYHSFSPSPSSVSSFCFSSFFWRLFRIHSLPASRCMCLRISFSQRRRTRCALPHWRILIAFFVMDRQASWHDPWHDLHHGGGTRLPQYVR